MHYEEKECDNLKGSYERKLKNLIRIL